MTKGAPATQNYSRSIVAQLFAVVAGGSCTGGATFPAQFVSSSSVLGSPLAGMVCGDRRCTPLYASMAGSQAAQAGMMMMMMIRMDREVFSAIEVLHTTRTDSLYRFTVHVALFALSLATLHKGPGGCISMGQTVGTGQWSVCGLLSPLSLHKKSVTYFCTYNTLCPSIFDVFFGCPIMVG